jgi:hypothetical protein
MTVLEREPRLDLDLDLDLVQVDEVAARRDLREQVAQLERRLAGAVAAGFPHLVPEAHPAAAATRPAGPRVLDLGELERVRDGLADRLRAVEREAQALGARHAAARHLLERMRLEPGRYHWVRVRAEDLGEPGCQSWRVVPRLGLLGMLMGWWRVKHSSGCPLATAG